MRPLTWTITERDGVTSVALSGDITEVSNLGALVPALSKEEVVLDLADVHRINSCGVREWINFVNALSEQGRSFFLDRCSVAIVNQLNMVSNFRSTGVVRSVFAPYLCPKCDEERLRLVEVKPGVRPEIDDAPSCPVCGAAMEFDDVPELFLSWHTA